jgi:hypothetical protein
MAGRGERTMKEQRLRPVGITCMIGLVLVFSCSARAQDQPPAQQPGDQEQQSSGAAAQTQESTTLQDVPVNAPTPGYPIDTQIYAAGKAIPWMGTTSPLRWGDFSVANVTLNYVNDNFVPAGTSTASTLNLAVLRTTLAFDRFFGKQHLVLQYLPQVAALNGQIRGNGGFNNALTLGTKFELSPRLTLAVNDGFAQIQSRTLFPPEILAVDQQTGNVVQNNFLQNSGSYIENVVSATFAYQISPRITLSVSPGYRYAHTTDTTQVNYVANGHTIENSTAITYAVTQRQNVGVIHSLQLLHATDIQAPGNTYFNVVGLYYSYQVSRTWWLEGEFGVDLAHYSVGIPSVHALAGTFKFVKTFSNSTLAMNYVRGEAEQNFITARIGDRADITYGLHFLRRLLWNNGAGYYSEIGAPPQTKGAYGSSEIEFALAKSLALTGSVTHMFQQSDTPQLLSGIRNTFVFGIRWQPPEAPGH